MPARVTDFSFACTLDNRYNVRHARHRNFTRHDDFRPAYRRIDRQFDREHYVAQRVVDDFGERLRTGTDPLTAAEDLTSAVERTLQPVAIGVWTTGPRS